MIGREIRAVLISAAYLLGTPFLGLIAVIPLSMVLMRRGTGGGWVPSVDFAMIVLLVVGLIMDVVLSFLISERWILSAIAPLAELRAIPSAKSEAVLDGDPSAAEHLALEFIGAIGLAIGAWLASRRPGTWQRGFAIVIKKLRAAGGNKIETATICSVIALGSCLIVGYLVGPNWGTRAERLSLLLPIIPLLTAIAVSLLIAISHRN